MPAIQIRNYPVRVYPPLAGGQPPVVPPDPEPEDAAEGRGRVILVIIGISIGGALVLELIRTSPRPVEWVNVGCGVVAFLVMAAAFAIIRRAYV